MSDDGMFMIVLTHREILYARAQRTTKMTHRGYGQWEIMPEFTPTDSIDDDDDSQTDEEAGEDIEETCKIIFSFIIQFIK